MQVSKLRVESRFEKEWQGGKKFLTILLSQKYQERAFEGQTQMKNILFKDSQQKVMIW